MRRLLLTTLAVVLVGLGAWWRVSSTPVPVTGPRGVIGDSGAGTGGGGADGDVRRADTAAGRVLPRFADTIWRETAVLNERRFVTWSLNSRPGVSYLLQYVCLTPGELHVRLRGTVHGWSKSVSCPGPFASVRFVAGGDRVTVLARRLNHRHVEVVLQVVVLP